MIFLSVFNSTDVRMRTNARQSFLVSKFLINRHIHINFLCLFVHELSRGPLVACQLNALLIFAFFSC